MDVSWKIQLSIFLLWHLGVMPPDEYYYNVNNSVYTNTVAKLRYYDMNISLQCILFYECQ